MNSSERHRQANEKRAPVFSLFSAQDSFRSLRRPSRQSRSSAGARRLARPTAAERSPFATGLRLAVCLSAVALLLHRAVSVRFDPVKITVLPIATLLLLLVGFTPVFRSRERIVTLTAPVVFALSLWMGPTLAALSILCACLVQARFGSSAGTSRRYLRFQGAQLTLSLFVAHAVLTAAARILPASTSPLLPIAITAVGAAAFTGANTLLTAGAHWGAWRMLLRMPAARMQFRGLSLVYALGMLSIVLLAPLGTLVGVAVVLPLLLLLLLSAQVMRLIGEVDSLCSELRAVGAMSRASITNTAGAVDPAGLLQRFLTLAGELVVADRALVWTMDQKTGELTPIVGMPDRSLYGTQKAVFGEGLIGQAAARYQPCLIANAARDPRRGPREIASGAWLLYPIVVQERLLGVAQWIRSIHHPFTSEEMVRLAALVPQAAIALENVRVREAMHTLAATDGLTGLWNHRRLHELLRDEIRRAIRYHRVCSVLMLDVDSFKTFNDTYGHPQGDQLLRSIASILRENIRVVDHVGRYGGEEFLVVLPETSKDDAYRMAERIRGEVEDKAYILVADQAIHRTVSVGVASYPEDALNPRELMQRADEALYRAKRAGKNCVIWA